MDGETCPFTTNVSTDPSNAVSSGRGVISVPFIRSLRVRLEDGESPPTYLLSDWDRYDGSHM